MSICELESSTLLQLIISSSDITLFCLFSPDYAVMCKQEKCTGKKHIDDELKRVISLGGEGLMIREPASKYERRRSNTLLKIKTFYDAEV